MIIQNQEVVTSAILDLKGKWAGWILKDTIGWQGLLSTEPIYDSFHEAIRAMDNVVKMIRDLDLSEHTKELKNIMNGAQDIWKK